jgi:hypothetical protein
MKMTVTTTTMNIAAATYLNSAGSSDHRSRPL